MRNSTVRLDLTPPLVLRLSLTRTSSIQASHLLPVSCTVGCCSAFMVRSYFICFVVFFLNFILVYISLTRHQFDVVFDMRKFSVPGDYFTCFVDS